MRELMPESSTHIDILRLPSENEEPTKNHGFLESEFGDNFPFDKISE